jgi:hypothetical protein
MSREWNLESSCGSRDGSRDIGIASLLSVTRLALFTRLGSRLLKRLLKVCNDIVDVFSTNGNTDEVLLLSISICSM